MSTRALAIALLLMAPAMAYGAAGRLLYTMGDVQVQRGAEVVAAHRGTPVEAKDRIVVAAAARAQLRMADGALIALQPSSTLVVDEFRVPEDSGVGASVLSLLKGGLRTLTGFIGKRQGDTYRLNTAVATIGVRGTDYRGALCQGDCGATPDGLYLGVSGNSPGGIVVSNGAGELILSGNEYAWVPGPNSPPQRLLQPPQILETVLNGTGGVGGGGGGEVAGGPNDSDDCHCDPNETDPGYHDIVVPGKLLGAEGQMAVAHTTSSTAVGAVDVGASIDPRPPANVNDEEELRSFRALTGAGAQAFQADSHTSVVNVGFDPVTQMRWGRWTDSASIGGAAVDLQNHDLHWIAGPESGALFALPVSGTASYDLVGNTNPTDNQGHVGFLGSASLSADFTNQTVTNTLNLTIADQTWNASGAASLHSPLPLFGGNYSTVSVGQAQGTGSFAGFFVPGSGGNLPDGAGLTYNLNNGGVAVNGAAAFGRRH